MHLNPYEELGVDRDATAAEARKAYRRKAKKAHPDAGGTPETFARLSTALAVITDPRKRQTYDETGRIEENKPDNDRVAAMQVIDRCMADIMNGFFSTFHPGNDPRKMDVPSIIATKIGHEITKGRTAIVGGQKMIKFLLDMERRFKRKQGASADDDPIGRGLRYQIEQNEQQLATVEHSIKVHEMAIGIVKGYDFEQDQPMQQTFSYADLQKAGLR